MTKYSAAAQATGKSINTLPQEALLQIVQQYDYRASTILVGFSSPVQSMHEFS